MVTVGIDEVGRGCWAGPLVAGAVVLRQPIDGVKDSKKLSRLQREKLVVCINREALALGLGWVWPAEIDAAGLSAAVTMAMQRAMDAINVAYDEIIIDGAYNFLRDIPKTRTVIRADDTVPAVSAASIVAKVARDHYMATLGSDYEIYEFAKHVGYGTTLHRQRLETHGVSDQHRKSFKPIQALLQYDT